MPTISESKKGKIKIAVNYSDHNPPHFHVIKGKKTIALVSIRDAVVIEGSLADAAASCPWLVRFAHEGTSRRLESRPSGQGAEVD